MSTTPAVVEVTRRIEESRALDAPAALVRRVADRLLADPARRDALHGTWLGHAVHPVMTDLPVGFWTTPSRSASTPRRTAHAAAGDTAAACCSVSPEAPPQEWEATSAGT